MLEGEITIRLKDGEKKYKAGETFTDRFYSNTLLVEEPR